MIRSLPTVLSKSCQFALERVATRMFLRPDIAIRCTYNTVKPTPEQVISHYFQGLYLSGVNNSDELVWESTAERGIITPDSLHLGKTIQRYMRKEMVEIRTNENFEEVIRNCQRTDEWTWINEPLIGIYQKLFSMGWARSMEAWRDGELVAGLWGLKIGRTYSVMSMFHNANRAGSVLWGHLLQRMSEGEIAMIDTQILTPHFERSGAYTVPVETFIEKLVHNFTDQAEGRLNGKFSQAYKNGSAGIMEAADGTS